MRNRPVDDLVEEESLVFVPFDGAFDIEAVAEVLASIGYAYRDEVNPIAFAVFTQESARDECKRIRQADPRSTFPYVLRLVVRPQEMVVYPVADQDDLRALTKKFLEWLVHNYDCRIENDFGTDISTPKPPKETTPS